MVANFPPIDLATLHEYTSLPKSSFSLVGNFFYELKKLIYIFKLAFHTLGNKLFPKPKKPALKPHLPWIKKLCESGGIIQIPSPEKIEALLIPESVVLLAGLKQKSSPNKAQTLFISHKYVAIMIEPLNKTERYSCTKSL